MLCVRAGGPHCSMCGLWVRGLCKKKGEAREDCAGGKQHHLYWSRVVGRMASAGPSPMLFCMMRGQSACNPKRAVLRSPPRMQSIGPLIKNVLHDARAIGMQPAR